MLKNQRTTTCHMHNSLLSLFRKVRVIARYPFPVCRSDTVDRPTFAPRPTVVCQKCQQCRKKSVCACGLRKIDIDDGGDRSRPVKLAFNNRVTKTILHPSNEKNDEGVMTPHFATKGALSPSKQDSRKKMVPEWKILLSSHHKLDVSYVRLRFST